MGLDAPLQDRVAGLFGHISAEAVFTGRPLCLNNSVCGERRGAEIANLARPLQICKCRESLLVAGGRVPPVDLVQIDVVYPEPAEAVVELHGEPTAGTALIIQFIAHRHVGLRRQDEVVAATGDRTADHLFGLSLAVHVGCVDDIDPSVKSGIDDGGRFLLGGATDGAEVHRSERQGADLDAGTTQGAVLHGVSSDGVTRELVRL